MTNKENGACERKLCIWHDKRKKTNCKEEQKFKECIKNGYKHFEKIG